MSELLEKAASHEVLNATWKRFRNDKAIWTTGLSRREMESNLVYHLVKLSNELRTGAYIPDPVRFFPVNKGDGKQRIISANTLRDKVAQRAVLTVIEPFGEKIFHHDSFGYRSGRTIDMVLSRVREYMLCGLSWVVRGFLSAPKGIPQGAVLSPFLCNVYLTSWDNDMSAKNLPFVRSADDFLVFAKCRANAIKAYTYVGKSLKRLGLMLNEQKTRTVQCGPNVHFLGRKLPKLKAAKAFAN